MIIDGKIIANQIQEALKKEIRHTATRPPCLAALLVGNHLPSQIYVKRKIEACAFTGIHSRKQEFPVSISEADLLDEITLLNRDPNVDGILVQFPLPPHIHSITVTHHIHPKKDVDGFHPENMGKLLLGDVSGFIPCTPLGIKILLEHSAIDIMGKHVLIVGRSNIVGKPLAVLLMQKHPGGNATVTVAHSHTKNLKSLCQTADILIAAVGQAQFITADMVKEGGIVIDVGINRLADSTSARGYRMVGDVDFERVAPKCAAITPVPGGVGPMTIAMLLHNTWLSYRRSMGISHGSRLDNPVYFC